VSCFIPSFCEGSSTMRRRRLSGRRVPAADRCWSVKNFLARMATRRISLYRWLERMSGISTSSSCVDARVIIDAFKSPNHFTSSYRVSFLGTFPFLPFRAFERERGSNKARHCFWLFDDDVRVCPRFSMLPT
jgi:hypothetical protein